MVGILHLSNHFITIYICNDYWTVSDPLEPTPPRRHPIPTWEAKIHASLRTINNALHLPPPRLPRYRSLPTPLSIQSDGDRA